MGYDTKLVFVTNREKSSKRDERIAGYCSVVASIELGCAAYDDFGELIDKCRKEVAPFEKAIREDIEHMQELHNSIFNHEGEFCDEYKALTKKEQKHRTTAYYMTEKGIQKKVPYFYADNGNDEIYEDSYGDLLLVASLAEVRKAINRSNAKLITKGDYENGYRRFNAALKLIEGLENFGEEISVVLFGH